MNERNWVAPEGCTYVIDKNATPNASDLRHYGGYLVAESIFHEDDMALILAAPTQAVLIKNLSAHSEQVHEILGESVGYEGSLAMIARRAVERIAELEAENEELKQGLGEAAILLALWQGTGLKRLSEGDLEEQVANARRHAELLDEKDKKISDLEAELRDWRNDI